MMPPVKEPLAGLALLVIFGLLIWHNRPIENAPVFDPYVQHKDRSITGYAYESWLWEDPFGFEPGKEFGDQCKKRLANTNHVKILAPVLKVQPNTLGNKELRTRQRYAVIAGLIESDYRPVEPDRMRFCSFQNGDKQYNVHWERFRHKSKDKSGKEERDKDKTDKNPDIIVAWMNSEIFTRNDKLPHDAYIFVQENLLKAEQISKEETNKSKLYIFDLNNVLDQNNKNENIIKFTTNDKRLIEKLTKELALRNIKESSEVIVIAEEDSESARKQASSFDEVFCKSPFENPESGTRECEVRKVYYLKSLDGRQRKIDEKNKNEDEVADKQADHRSVINLHNSSPLPIGPSQLDYFHRLAGQIEDPHNDINLAKRDTGIKAVGIFGSEFHDKLLILEALREEMPNILVFTTDLDAQMLYRQHWRSARNLVVASHFNLLLKGKDKDKDKDKERYRNQCKDLEKYQKQSKEEEKYKQFLRDYCAAVASLSAGAEKYQEHFPAFRDSQQTNIFFSTLNVVTEDFKKFETTPQIFETGRNGFVRLAQEKNEDLNYHPPDTTSERTIMRLVLLFVIIVFLIGFQREFRPNSQKSSKQLWRSTLVIFAIALFFATDELGEPVSFTDGISLWPTILIQLIAVLLALSFFYIARRDLDKSFCCLSRQYFQLSLYNNHNRVFSSCPTKYCGWDLRNFGELKRWLCFIFTVSFFIYAYNDVNPSGFPFVYCLVLLFLFLFIYLSVMRNRDFVSVKDWMEKDHCEPSEKKQDKISLAQDQISSWLCNNLHKVWNYFGLKHESDSHSEACQESYEDGLWEEYYKYGFIDHRASRVVAIWLFFAFIETILIYLLPPWPLPCRGAVVCFVASVISVTGFTVVMLLLFFILDAVRLNFYWIQKLRKGHPLLRDKITQEHFNAFAMAKKNNPIESLEKIVAVVAERTRVVDKLIYYAIFCIMLMLFAKITYFDNQDFPLSKGITFAASISLLFFSGFMLRYAAKQLKLSVKKSIENLGKNDRRLQPEGDAAIKRIDAIDEGAFQPMLEQPVMQALLLILASVGLFAGEYLKLLG